MANCRRSLRLASAPFPLATSRHSLHHVSSSSLSSQFPSQYTSHLCASFTPSAKSEIPSHSSSLPNGSLEMERKQRNSRLSKRGRKTLPVPGGSRRKLDFDNVSESRAKRSAIMNGECFAVSRQGPNRRRRSDGELQIQMKKTRTIETKSDTRRDNWNQTGRKIANSKAVVEKSQIGRRKTEVCAAPGLLICDSNPNSSEIQQNAALTTVGFAKGQLNTIKKGRRNKSGDDGGRVSSCNGEADENVCRNQQALVPAYGGALEVPPLAACAASISCDTAIIYQGPYSSYMRPTPEECREARDRLQALHGPLEDFTRHRISCPTRSSQSECLAIEDNPEEKTGQEISIVQQKGAEQADANSVKEKAEKHALVTTGHPRERYTVLDSLIGTILSQNTTDTNSRRAYSSLKKAFPSWEEVHEADPKEVEEAIRCGGLAEIKAARIQNILATLLKERGEICLEHVRSMSTDQVKAELSRFKGVGPKTVACVLMFHLQQDEFPVDTHVYRISKMLGWVPANANREKAYLHLNHRIPNDVKFDLHCLLVTHGKRCPSCAKRGQTQNPADGPCPLVNWSYRLPELAVLDITQDKLT